MSALISTQELARKLMHSDVRIVDASWHMPAEKRSAGDEYAASHIPGAVFFDLDATSDHASPYPHMLPGAEVFAAAMSALGIGNNTQVIVYDVSGLFSAARLWWMLRVFGHTNVKLLDGGLPKWKAESRPLESGAPPVPAASFLTHFSPALLRSLTQMQENVQSKIEQVADARSPARFNGTEPEPRPGLASGHIPASINVHFRECLLPPYNMLRPVRELSALFKNKGIDVSQPIIATCGSGVTACILALALYETGSTDVAVYDGSWAEWGSVCAGSIRLPGKA